jgi:hypothetical protein
MNDSNRLLLAFDLVFVFVTVLLLALVATLALCFIFEHPVTLVTATTFHPVAILAIVSCEKKIKWIDLPEGKKRTVVSVFP